MRLTTLLLTAVFLQAHATGKAQQVTITGRQLTLREVFKAIKDQTGHVVLNQKGVLSDAKPVAVSAQDMPLRQLLALIFKSQPLEYDIQGKTILVTRKRQPEPQVADVAPVPAIEIAFTPISGVVRSADGKPMPGVNIVVMGQTKGAVTAANGTFSLEVVDGDVVRISAVGFMPLTLRRVNGNFVMVKAPTESRRGNTESDEAVSAMLSGNGNFLSVRLVPSPSPLDEVQVMAYGTTTKRFNAGNITSIAAKEIAKNPVNNVMEALQGKVPGLFIQQVTGQPGGAFTVRMRGSANLTTGATQPLIIVDGVRFPAGTLPLSSNTLYATQSFLQGGSGLNYLNPNDIESVDVLKDVDATAIYGSSGAYGVILITTKKARANRQAFNANIYTGVSVMGKAPELMNTEQYLMLRREALKNDGITVTAQDLDLNGTWPEDRYTNWRKELMGKAAATTNANLSYSGGAGNTTYLFSGSLRNTGNIQRHKGSNRDGSLRFALSTGTTDNKFNLSLTGTYLSAVNDMVPQDFSGSVMAVPNAPRPFNPDGSINWDAIGTNLNSTSFASNFYKQYKHTTDNLLANATLTYRPAKNITLNSVFGYNTINGKELVGNPTTTFHPSNIQAATQTVGILHNYSTRSITISPYGEYRRTVATQGNLSVKLGAEISNQVTQSTDITGTGFPSDALLANPAVATSVVSRFELNEYRSIGTYGIVKFIWNEKYIANVNLRYDGSTKFGPGRRFGSFGSGALAWIFSEERLIKNNIPLLSFGKLRVSSGVVGGDAIGNFRYLETYQAMSGNYDGKTGLQPNALPNPLLNWERNFNSEIGLELGFLQDRIMADFSYYHNRAGNQLLGQPLSSVTGYTSYTLNSDALIRTSGYEASITSNNFRKKDFSWTTRFNITIPESKLLRLPTQANQNSNYVQGKPVTGLLLYKYNGVNPQTGYYSFTNGKGVTDDFSNVFTQADKTEFIDLAPKYFGSLTNSFTYKQFVLDFSINFTSRMGKNLLSNAILPFGIFGGNGSTMWLDRWQQPGDQTAVPKVSTQFSNFSRQMLFNESTGAYSDATYARLQNVSLRYNFSESLNKTLHLKNGGVYLQGQNLLTISKYNGLDPENLNPSVIPPLRVITAGINVTL
ncbi:SusC/RagA family TonB-linked outer membrane protein [Chitinophaga pollutisoli]|uniref:SusC/RagA family TonB-linked outer membrane protein n=1 Tax=Chitinophaga pollutisoli TaxID=3133966 RepID=A0ABZ2YLF6_9BACT